MANTRAILPKSVKKLEGIGSVLRREQANTANLFYKRQLEEVVKPFDSRITFETQNRYNNGDYVTNIGPSKEVAGTNAAGDSVTSLELFKWLDEGTSVRYVGMPDSFTNETRPNSTFTNHADYSRDDIYFVSEPFPGIEARNFLKLVGEMYVNIYRNSIGYAIKNYIES